MEKQSYTDALFADGASTAQYAGPGDPTADLPGWFTAISAGEPTAQNDPLVAQALTQLETYRSAYYLPVPGQTRKLAFQLWPTAWALGAGHQLKLELTPDDSPTWRPDNLPATMTLTHISLTISAWLARRRRCAAGSPKTGGLAHGWSARRGSPLAGQRWQV